MIKFEDGYELRTGVKSETWDFNTKNPYEITYEFYKFCTEYKHELERYYNFKMHKAHSYYCSFEEEPWFKARGFTCKDAQNIGEYGAFYEWCETIYVWFKQDVEFEGIEDTFYHVGRTSSRYISEEVSHAMHARGLDMPLLFYNITGWDIEDIFTCDEWQEEACDDAWYKLKPWIENTKKLIDLYLSYEENQVELFEDWLKNEVGEYWLPEKLEAEKEEYEHRLTDFLGVDLQGLDKEIYYSLPDDKRRLYLERINA